MANSHSYTITQIKSGIHICLYNQIMQAKIPCVLFSCHILTHNFSIIYSQFTTKQKNIGSLISGQACSWKHETLIKLANSRKSTNSM